MFNWKTKETNSLQGHTEPSSKKRCEHRKNDANTVDIFLVCELQMPSRERTAARLPSWNTQTMVKPRRVCVLSFHTVQVRSVVSIPNTEMRFSVNHLSHVFYRKPRDKFRTASMITTMITLICVNAPLPSDDYHISHGSSRIIL